MISSVQQWVDGLGSDLKPDRLLSSLFTAVVLGVISIVVVIADASLIFSGDLARFAPRGIGLALVGAVVVMLVVGLTSSYPGMIAMDQEAPVVILALAAAEMARQLDIQGAPEQAFMTIVAMLIIAAVVTGAFFYLVGLLRLGGLFRYLPYPVIGGFLAGTGWVLLVGGLGVAADVNVQVTNILVLFQDDLLLRWGPALLLGGLLLFFSNKLDHYFVLPGILLISGLFFYLVIWGSGGTLAAVRAAGWLLGPFPETNLFQGIGVWSLDEVDWTLIFNQTGRLVTLIIVTSVALLLNASGLEQVIGRDVDFNHELKSAGIANVLLGLMGGFIGFQTLSLTALNRKLTQGSKLTNVFTAGVLLLCLFFGASILALFPKFLVSGLLIYLGLGFLQEWVLGARATMPLLDYLAMLAIVLVIALVGFLEGVVVGVNIAVIIFVFNYSRTSVIRQVLSGEVYRSKLTRPAAERQVLAKFGSQLEILRLQGYLFFGTVTGLLEHISHRLHLEGAQGPLRYVLLDFSGVSGVDSSILVTLQKLRQFRTHHAFTLIFTRVSPKMYQQFTRGGAAIGSHGDFMVFDDLDQAVEWCEDQILSSELGAAAEGQQTLQALLQAIEPRETIVADLIGYLLREEVQAGTVLIRQGDPPDHIYYIESGRVTAQIVGTDNQPIRLQTMTGENVVGEVGTYLKANRTASVVADCATVVYCMSAAQMARMEAEAPQAAALFHKFLAQIMAERIAHLTKVVAVSTS